MGALNHRASEPDLARPVAPFAKSMSRRSPSPKKSPLSQSASVSSLETSDTEGPPPILRHKTSAVLVSSPLRQQVGFEADQRRRAGRPPLHSSHSASASLGSDLDLPRIRSQRGRSGRHVAWAAQTVHDPGNVREELISSSTTVGPSARQSLRSSLNRRSSGDPTIVSTARARPVSARARPGSRVNSTIGLWGDIGAAEPVPIHPSTAMPGFPAVEFADHAPPKFSRQALQRQGVIMPVPARPASIATEMPLPTRPPQPIEMPAPRAVQRQPTFSRASIGFLKRRLTKRSMTTPPEIKNMPPPPMPRPAPAAFPFPQRHAVPASPQNLLPGAAQQPLRTPTRSFNRSAPQPQQTPNPRPLPAHFPLPQQLYPPVQMPSGSNQPAPMPKLLTPQQAARQALRRFRSSPALRQPLPLDPMPEHEPMPRQQGASFDRRQQPLPSEGMEAGRPSPALSEISLPVVTPDTAFFADLEGTLAMLSLPGQASPPITAAVSTPTTSPPRASPEKRAASETSHTLLGPPDAQKLSTSAPTTPKLSTANLPSSPVCGMDELDLNAVTPTCAHNSSWPSQLAHTPLVHSESLPLATPPPRGESLIASSLGATSSPAVWRTRHSGRRASPPLRRPSRSASSMSHESMCSEASTLSSLTTASSAASIDMPDPIDEASEDHVHIDVFGVMPAKMPDTPRLSESPRSRQGHSILRQAEPEGGPEASSLTTPRSSAAMRVQ